MSYHKGTYEPPDHKTHTQVWDLSDQLYSSKEDCLVENFVSVLLNVVFLEKWNIKIDEVRDGWKGWNVEKKKDFSAQYRDIAILLPIQVDEQLIKAIIPFWDPSYKCFTFNQKDKVLTIEKYTALLHIETPNPNKVF